MNRFVKVLLLVSCGALLASNSFAAGNVAAGKEKSATCAACHGPDGNSAVGTWPKLAGQSEKYLLAQMTEFKKGEKGGRFEAVMTPQMQPLSQQDMQDLAAFYAAQKVKVGGAQKELLAEGQQIYRGGNIDKHITACIACHGPKGKGNKDAGFPSLTGQHPEYIVTQLEAYKAGKRKNDMNEIMRDIAKRMDKKDMQAVANYIAGLH